MALVGFSGPRRLPVGQVQLFSAVVGSLLRAGRGIGVGCAAGADALVIAATLAAGGAPSLSVFAAFGPEGQGAGRSSALLPVWLAQRAGASVSFFAGGESPPLLARLARRSQALVSAVSVSGLGCGFVGFPTRPCPSGVIPSQAWQSCGSGTWSTLLLAAGKGVSVVVVPVGWRWQPPAWPGRWEPAGRAWPWSAGWRWVPGPGALELAQRLGRREAEAQERRQRQVRVQQQKQPAAREVRARRGGRRGRWVA